jgi:hypothetical protein
MQSQKQRPQSRLLKWEKALGFLRKNLLSGMEPKWAG